MPQWIQDLFAGWPMIRANLPTFFFIVVLIFGAIWWLMDWRYGGVIAQRDGVINNRDSEITLLKGQRDDYKDKLSGATPDQAKARIDALEARLASVEPRRLTASQRTALIAGLIPPRAISIVSEAAGDSPQLATDFASVFKSAGWLINEGSVMGLGNRPPTGIAVQIPDPNNPSQTATVLMNALRSQNIRFDIRQAPNMPDSELSLLICTKIER